METGIKIFPILRIIEAGRRVVLIGGGGGRRRSDGGGRRMRRLREIRRRLLLVELVVVETRAEISQIGVAPAREELAVLQKLGWQRRGRRKVWRRRGRHGRRRAVDEVSDLGCLLLDAFREVEFSFGAFEAEGGLIVG